MLIDTERLIADRPVDFHSAVRPRMARLIFVNRHFWPDQSATARILSTVAFDLSEQGYDVHVVTDQASHDGQTQFSGNERHLGVQIQRINTSMHRRGGEIRRILGQIKFQQGARRHLLKLLRPDDVVIAKTDPPLLSVSAADAARKRQARLVNWIQEVYPESSAALGIWPSRIFPGAMLARWRDRALQQAQANIVTGEIMSIHLQRLGVSPSRVHFLPNFAEDQKILPKTPGQSRLRSEWGFAPNQMVVGYAGVLGRTHHVQTLLEAAAMLKDLSDIRFLFIGGGDQYRVLQDKVEVMGLQGFVCKLHPPGHCPGEVLTACDLHCLSLRPELEGCLVPSSIYSIAAAGRGVIMIGHPKGEIARLLSRFGWGMNVVPGNSRILADMFRELADNPEKRCRLGEAARDFIDGHASRQRALWNWRALAQSWASLPSAEVQKAGEEMFSSS